MMTQEKVAVGGLFILHSALSVSEVIRFQAGVRHGKRSRWRIQESVSRSPYFVTDQ